MTFGEHLGADNQIQIACCKALQEPLHSSLSLTYIAVESTDPRLGEALLNASFQLLSPLSEFAEVRGMAFLAAFRGRLLKATIMTDEPAGAMTHQGHGAMRALAFNTTIQAGEQGCPAPSIQE